MERKVSEKCGSVEEGVEGKVPTCPDRVSDTLQTVAAVTYSSSCSLLAIRFLWAESILARTGLKDVQSLPALLGRPSLARIV
jgi:hypothetical protein